MPILAPSYSTLLEIVEEAFRNYESSEKTAEDLFKIYFLGQNYGFSKKAMFGEESGVRNSDIYLAMKKARIPGDYDSLTSHYLEWEEKIGCHRR